MTALLQFRSVSKWYGPVLGISDVSFEVTGGVVGLLGQNGAGKSTVLKLAAGLIDAGIGQVTVNGSPPRDDLEARRTIGLCPDVDRFYEAMSGLDWVVWMARLHGIPAREARARGAETMDRVGMADNMNKRIGAYSKGMRQRTKLARALIHEPSMLLLDEPLTGLDPVGRHDMVELIRGIGAEGRAVVVSSNVLSEVEQMTDQLILIHQGRLLAEGGIKDVRDAISDQPHKVAIGAKEPRRLAAELIALPGVTAVEIRADNVVVEVSEAGGFFAEVTRLGADPTLGFESVIPLDSGLDAIFGYLVG